MYSVGGCKQQTLQQLWHQGGIRSTGGLPVFCIILNYHHNVVQTFTRGKDCLVYLSSTDFTEREVEMTIILVAEVWTVIVIIVVL